MSRILFSPESFNMGETTRGIEIARVAQDRGHKVLFHIYSPKYRGLLESARLPVHLREPIMTDAEAKQLMALDQGRGVRHPFTTEKVRQRVTVELAAIRDFNADAVVIGSNPTMLISARIAGVPIFYARPYAYSTTYFSAKPAGQAPSAPGWLRTLVRAISYKPASFTRVAREHGIKLPRRTVDMFSADVNLICSLFTELRGDPLTAPDVSVGPIYYRAPGELPRIVREPKKRPLIYVGMGSSGSARILAAVLRQLSTAPVDVLVGDGVLLSDADARSLGDNIHRAGTVPAHLLAGHIDASITHGGKEPCRQRAWRGYRSRVSPCRPSNAGILRNVHGTATPCASRNMMCTEARCAAFWIVYFQMRPCVPRPGSSVRQCAAWTDQPAPSM